MATWIALLRGINVGGRNILPMADLRKDLESLKFKQVRTYIQSGNAIFESSARNATSLTKKIGDLLEERHGFRIHLFVLRHADLLAAVEANPFSKAVKDPKSLHFFFLSKPAKSPNTEALDKARSKSEKYKLTAHMFYLFAPDGIARSKLAANAEKYLGVATTARNFRTVSKLVDLAQSDQQ